MRETRRECLGYRQRRALIAVLLVALSGCDVKHPVANLVRGKQLFVSKCGSCHTLSHAGTPASTGPNLDYAFAAGSRRRDQERRHPGDGRLLDPVPQLQGVMPAGSVQGQDAADVAAYVGLVAAVPGQDAGALASAVPTVNQKPVTEKAGKLADRRRSQRPAEVPRLERDRHARAR